jgi:hypothetical protein
VAELANPAVAPALPHAALVDITNAAAAESAQARSTSTTYAADAANAKVRSDQWLSLLGVMDSWHFSEWGSCQDLVLSASQGQATLQHYFNIAITQSL